MSVPTDRTSFKEYCLRILGAPVIAINVDPLQVDDCVDYAIAKWNDYHFDGNFKTYVSYPVQPQDITNRFITLPTENIKDIIRIFPLSSTIMGVGMWNLQYQFILTSLDVFRVLDMSNWVTTMQNIQLIEQILVGLQPIRFNRFNSQTLYIDMDWTQINVGDFLIIDCYVAVDPDQSPQAWNDPWLIQYATAQIKMRWGNALKKYKNIQLPGGGSFSGQEIYQEAVEEIRLLETRANIDYAEMPGLFIG